MASCDFALATTAVMSGLTANQEDTTVTVSSFPLELRGYWPPLHVLDIVPVAFRVHRRCFYYERRSSPLELHSIIAWWRMDSLSIVYRGRIQKCILKLPGIDS